MSSTDSSSASEQTLAIARVVSFLLLGSELCAAGAVFYLAQNGYSVPAIKDPGIGWLDFTATSLGVLSIVLALIFRKVIWASAEGREHERVMAAFLRGTIAYMVLLEVACMFSLVSWLLTSRAVPSAMMALLLFLLGLIGVPRNTI